MDVFLRGVSQRAGPHDLALAGLCAAFMLAVLWLDFRMPRGIGTSIAYVVPVMLGLWLPWRFAPAALAIIATVLALGAFALKQPYGEAWVGWFNRSLSLGAIWVTAFLCELRADATRRLQQLQSDLHRLGRRCELTEMVGAIAHELNQPLAAVHTYVAAASRTLDAPGGDTALARDTMAKALQQADRAGDTLRQIRRMLQEGGRARTVEDINDVVREILPLALAGAAPANLDVTTEFAAQGPRCAIDRTQIQQVVLHLVRNSIDALHDGARRELRIRVAREPDGMSAVSVADTGPGLSGEVQSRLFMPFVTTKPGGVGVGLSISQSIVESHGGRIYAAPNPGGGTVFTFTLPPAA